MFCNGEFCEACFTKDDAAKPRCASYDTIKTTYRALYDDIMEYLEENFDLDAEVKPEVEDREYYE